MKIMAINRETEVEESKLFGEAYIPDCWLEDNIFSPYEFFLCQLRLADFNFEFLPSSGYLYIFLEAYSFNFSKLKAKVRYYTEEPDAYTDFNDGYFEEDLESFALIQESIGILNADVLINESVCILEIPANLLPFDIKVNKMRIMITKEDLASRKFDNCSLVFVN